jgi:hypothetical protein
MDRSTTKWERNHMATEVGAAAPGAAQADILADADDQVSLFQSTLQSAAEPRAPQARPFLSPSPQDPSRALNAERNPHPLIKRPKYTTNSKRARPVTSTQIKTRFAK